MNIKKQINTSKKYKVFLEHVVISEGLPIQQYFGNVWYGTNAMGQVLPCSNHYQFVCPAFTASFHFL